MSTGVRVVSAATLEWEPVGSGNVRQKIVRANEETGEFLGLMSIDAFARTGLHKHLDVAFAYHLSGASTNYSTLVTRGQLGITLNGTVHETVIYEPTLSVVRTEGRTMYPQSSGSDHVHAGAVHGEMSVADRQWCGCLSIDAASVAAEATGVDGLVRRVLFDYAATGKNRRLCEFGALPKTAVAHHVAADRLEFYVIAGDIRANGLEARAGDFILVDAGTVLEWGSSFGSRVLVWADAAARSESMPGAERLYGF